MRGLNRCLGALVFTLAAGPVLVQAQSLPHPAYGAGTSIDQGTFTGGTFTGGDVSGQTVTPAIGGAPRTLAARASYAVNVLDFGTTADLGAALTAACNVVPSGGKVYLPSSAGPYQLGINVTACGGKTLTIEGDSAVINLTQPSAGLTIAETSASQKVTFRRFGFTSSASSMVARAIDISWPAVSSLAVQNLLVEDVSALSPPPPTVSGPANSAPYPGSFGSLMRINGAWNALISNTVFQGPIPNTNQPLVGTSGIEVQNSYATNIDTPKAFFADSAVLQTAYSEYINITNPQFVDVNYGLNVTNAVRSDKGNRAGLSYYLSGGEVDTILAGVNLVGVNDAYLYGTHYYFGRASGGGGIVLSDTNYAHVFGNTVIQGGSNVTATGVLVNGSSYGNMVIGNKLDTATAAALQSGTSGNTVVDNSSDTGFGGGYGDDGTNNTVTWRLQTGGIGSLHGHVFSGSGPFQITATPPNCGAAGVVTGTLCVGGSGGTPLFISP